MLNQTLSYFDRLVSFFTLWNFADMGEDRDAMRERQQKEADDLKAQHELEQKQRDDREALKADQENG